MHNELFPLLTKEMINANPRLSGTFYISDPITFDLPEMTMTIGRSFVFLQNGLLHNTNAPCLISHELKGVIYMEKGKFVENKPGKIRYASSGKIDGLNFIAPESVNPFVTYYNSKGKKHCISGASVRNSPSKIADQYFIDGDYLSFEEWKNHPEVLEYHAKLNLKGKMNEIFGAEG